MKKSNKKPRWIDCAYDGRCRLAKENKKLRHEIGDWMRWLGYLPEKYHPKGLIKTSTELLKGDIMDYDIKAEHFYEDTGIWPIGKDLPIGAIPDTKYDIRVKAYKYWCKIQKHENSFNALVDSITTALTIRALWLPEVEKEHESEAIALTLMKNDFEKALKIAGIDHVE